MFLGVLLLAFGCTRDSGDGGLPVDDRVLRRGNGGDPGTLDPAQATDVHSFNILVDLYEGLITEAADGDLIPGVAESWHISDDGLVYTFMLRDDARWSDGSRVVASDFVTSLQRAVAPGIAAPYGFLLEPLAGFDAIQSGEAPPEALGVVAATADTLQMTLSKPTAQWLSVLALPVAYPVKSASDGTVLTNGPYKLLERQAHGVVRLEKNGYYVILVDKRNPAFYKVSAEGNERGLIHVLTNLLPEKLKSFVKIIYIQDIIEKLDGNKYSWKEDFITKYGLDKK